MLERNYKDEVTHWAATPGDFGSFIFAAPVTVKGRWEEKSELFRTPEGEEEVSKSIVLLACDVNVDDYLFLGESDVADPTSISDTHQVRQFMKTPDLRSVEYLRRAIL